MRDLCICACLLCLLIGCERESTPATRPTTAPAATAPATTHASTRPSLDPYVELLRTRYPRIAATQPLGVPLDLIDAGHFVLNDPVYLCPRGDLWISAANAPAAQEAISVAGNQQIHLVRDRVAFVHWQIDRRGKWIATMVAASAKGGWELVDAGGRKSIGSTRNYRWREAARLNDDQIVVPTNRGVSVLSISSEPVEKYHELVGHETANPPRFQFERNGILAWVPWENAKAGSAGAARFADNQWTQLTEKQHWPTRILHLVPLLDGSVLQLLSADDGTIKLALAPLESTNIDENQVRSLVEQMSDPDPAKRTSAFNELTRYGPASWPILEKLQEDQPLETRMRIRQLLHDRIQPTLAGRTLVDGKARIVSRFADNGILLYAPAGVSMPREDHPPLITAPAWISIRPGRSIELLDPVLIQDADPDQQRIYAWADEWVVSDNVQGPRRLAGNHLQALLRAEEKMFSDLIGIDQRGRWLFRKNDQGAETLILDTTIPDPTPRLPVWLLNINNGQVGWEKNNWPVIKRPGGWFLDANGWHALDERTNPIIAQLPPKPTQPAPPPPATTQSTQPTTRPLGPLLLTDSDGKRYYDGHETITVIDKSNRRIVWPLPNNATGAGEVTLIRDKDGNLFLFNAPGRVVKIRPTPAEKTPFALDAVFTHRIPNIEHPTRIWLDPANRIIMVFETQLAIMFPEGRIPPALGRLIPLAELEDQEAR